MELHRTVDSAILSSFLLVILISSKLKGAYPGATVTEAEAAPTTHMGDIFALVN